MWKCESRKLNIQRLSVKIEVQRLIGQILVKIQRLIGQSVGQRWKLHKKRALMTLDCLLQLIFYSYCYCYYIYCPFFPSPAASTLVWALTLAVDLSSFGFSFALSLSFFCWRGDIGVRQSICPLIVYKKQLANQSFFRYKVVNREGLAWIWYFPLERKRIFWVVLRSGRTYLRKRKHVLWRYCADDMNEWFESMWFSNALV